MAVPTPKPTPKPDTERITAFTGLNNVADPLNLGLGGQVQADNGDINAKGKITRTAGYLRKITNTVITGAYSTHDLTRMYIVDNGSLLQVFPNMTTVSLKSGLSTTLPVYFDEVNGVVFYTNGVDFGMLDGSGWKPWGIASPTSPTAVIQNAGGLRAGLYMIVCTLTDVRGLESSNSDAVVVEVRNDNSRIYLSGIQQVTGYTTNVYVTRCDETVFYLAITESGTDWIYDAGGMLGRELPFWNQNTPRGIMPTYFAGRLYTAEYFPQSDVTAVWRSLPLHYHHFDPGGEGISVPGQVLQMRSTRETHFSGSEKLTQRGVADAIVIGTDREIYTWDEDQLVLLASYGVVPGYHAIEFKGKVYMWTLRGMCRALPFENLTQDTVSVAPGVSAGAVVIEKDGTKRYVVALNKGGVAYNQYNP